MILSESDLAELVGAVWTALLPSEEDDLTPSSKDCTDDTDLIGTVSISGSWNGEIVVECAQEIAEIFAGAMFARERDELEEEDLRDAVGEFVNQIGGNVKGVTEGACSLSLPQVARRGEGQDASDDDVTLELAFERAQSPVVVRIRDAA